MSSGVHGTPAARSASTSGAAVSWWVRPTESESATARATTKTMRADGLPATAREEGFTGARPFWPFSAFRAPGCPVTLLSSRVPRGRFRDAPNFLGESWRGLYSEGIRACVSGDTKSSRCEGGHQPSKRATRSTEGSGESQLRPEVLQRSREAFVERNPRLPSQQGAGTGDVGLPHARIVHGQRARDNAAA